MKNLWLGLKDQMPLKRFLFNLLVTGNALGLFYKRSHYRDNGSPKQAFPKKDSALRAAASMEKKHGVHFSTYKCIFCDGYHLGKNRTAVENKV